MTVQTIPEQEYIRSVSVAPETSIPDVSELFYQNNLLQDNTIIYLDGDIPIFKVASVTDNKQYVFRGKKFKYKKDAVKAAKANGFSEKDINEVYEPFSKEVAKAIYNNVIDNLYKATGKISTCITVSNGGSFRREIYQKYKSGREGKRVPVNRKPLIEHTIHTHRAIYVHGYEADDLMAIYGYNTERAGCNSVIATIDKDLDTVPGWHWNFDKGELYYVSELEAFRFFCTQVLMGDMTDSIPGLYRVGKVSASKMVAGCNTMEEMWQVVCNKYETTKPGDTYFTTDQWREYLYLIASMIFIRRNFNEPYHQFLINNGIDPMLPGGFVNEKETT